MNDFGQGRAVFLNLEISSYAYERLQPKSPTSLPDLLEGISGLEQIKAQVRVTDTAGKRLQGTEIVRFANGPYEHVGYLPESAIRRWRLGSACGSSTRRTGGRMPLDDSRFPKSEWTGPSFFIRRFWR